ATGKSSVRSGDDEAGQFVAVHTVAERGDALRIIADGAEDGPDRRAHYAQGQHDADEIAEGDKPIERPAGLEVDVDEPEIEARRRNAGQSVLAAGPGRERIEFDEIKDLADRHGDHGEIDPGAP